MIRWLIFTPVVAFIIIGALMYRLNLEREYMNKGQSTVKAAMDNSGFSSVENSNKKTRQKFFVDVRQGVAQIREQMEYVQEQNQRMMDRIDEQNQVLDNQSRSAQALRDEIGRRSGLSVDLAHVKELADAFDDQRRILTANGREMTQLNDQMRLKMDSLKQQMEAAKLLQETRQQVIKDRMDMLRDRMASLNEQQRSFMERAEEHRRDAQERTEGLKQRLMDTAQSLAATNGPGNLNLKQNVQQLLTKQDEITRKIREDKERIDLARQQLKERMETFQDRIKDLMAQNADKVNDDRQKAEDQKRMIEERVTDQMLRIKEQAMDRKK